MVDGTCARIDASFRAVGGPQRTFVISDHGHGAARSDFFTNRWLAREGYLVFRKPATGWHRRLAARVLLASERYRATRWLVRGLADRLRGGRGRNFVGKMLAGEGSFEAMAPNIDWERTVAFSYPVPEGIYLNRYRTAMTPEEADRTVAEIRHKLETCPDAHIEVFEPRELYRGRNLSNAPALLLRIDGLATETRMDFSYPEPMLRDLPASSTGAGSTGWKGSCSSRATGSPRAGRADRSRFSTWPRRSSRRWACRPTRGWPADRSGRRWGDPGPTRARRLPCRRNPLYGLP